MSEKNDSQKDLLFSKLLPALNDNPFSATPQEPIEIDEQSEDVLAALRSRIFARPSNYMPNSYATLNIMESLVIKHIDKVINRFNTCSCDRCKCDIAAFALTSLPPKYIVADPKLAVEMEEEISTKMVMDALVNAVIHVRSNPRH